MCRIERNLGREGIKKKSNLFFSFFISFSLKKNYDFDEMLQIEIKVERFFPNSGKNSQAMN